MTNAPGRRRLAVALSLAAALPLPAVAHGASKPTCPLLRGDEFRKALGALDRVQLEKSGRPWRSCLFFYPAAGTSIPAILSVERITVAEARQTVAAIRESNRTRPAKYRTPIAPTSGLGDEAWKVSRRGGVRSGYTDVRLIVRKGKNAFQIWANDEAWLDGGLTQAKLRALAKRAVRRI